MAKKEKSSFWKDFKAFLSKGSVLDLAVGVIIGTAFTAIVTALTNQILQPIINWVIGKVIGADSLSEVYTFLSKVYDADGAIDLVNSIYIDWGTFINAIINFLLVALVLFIIVRAITRSKKRAAEFRAKREEALKAEQETAEQPSEEPAPAPEPEPAPAPAVPTTEELLAEIRDLLKAQNCAENAKVDAEIASAKEE